VLRQAVDDEDAFEKAISYLLSKKWICPVTDEAARQKAGAGPADSTAA